MRSTTYPDFTAGHTEGLFSPDMKALYFSGFDSRVAETQDLNLKHGGIVNFQLLMGPKEGHRSNTDSRCKEAYQGDVTVAYSTDQGHNWYDIASYQAPLYNLGKWSHISAKLPKEGYSNTTRIRLYQGSFEEKWDHMAIDDLRIFAYFEPGWHEGKKFQRKVSIAHKDIEMAQCCFETDQCETWGVRADGRGVTQLKGKNYKTCKDVPSYDSPRKATYFNENNGPLPSDGRFEVT